jgi:hypothetical protein
MSLVPSARLATAGLNWRPVKGPRASFDVSCAITSLRFSTVRQKWLFGWRYSPKELGDNGDNSFSNWHRCVINRSASRIRRNLIDCWGPATVSTGERSRTASCPRGCDCQAMRSSNASETVAQWRVDTCNPATEPIDRLSAWNPANYREVGRSWYIQLDPGVRGENLIPQLRKPLRKMGR